MLNSDSVQQILSKQLTPSHAKACEAPTSTQRRIKRRATTPLMIPVVVKNERTLYKNVYNGILSKAFLKFY